MAPVTLIYLSGFCQSMYSYGTTLSRVKLILFTVAIFYLTNPSRNTNGRSLVFRRFEGAVAALQRSIFPLLTILERV